MFNTPTTRPDAQNWLGLPDPLPHIQTFAQIPLLPDNATWADAPPLREFLSNHGDHPAKLRSDIRVWWTTDSLRIHARFFTVNLARIERLINTNADYRRDHWGNDALEVQIDPGLTRVEYGHFILPPTAKAVTYLGFNNRHLQGYHPRVKTAVALDAAQGCWSIDAEFFFESSGKTPRPGDRWGFNLLRIDPDENGSFSQWAPTLGDVLRPERFGVIEFAPGPLSRELHEAQHEAARELAGYRARHHARAAHMNAQINTITSQNTLDQLNVADRQVWSQHLATRRGPAPVRWENATLTPGDVPASDHATALQLAAQALTRMESWDESDPPAAAFNPMPMEALADAYLITKEPRYAAAVEKAILVHDAYYRKILGKPGLPQGHEHRELYQDFQVVQAAWLAYAYLTIARAGLASPAVHEAAMIRILRAGRFASFNIAVNYNYGNHQIFESAGLAILAVLFPELSESNHWADVASRSLRHHFLRDVLPDGAYRERCGYHNVALTFTAQAIAAIEANNQRARFPLFMCDDVLHRIDNMYRWSFSMSLPDGTFPAFGDYRCHSIVRMLGQGTALRSLPNVKTPHSLTHADSQFTVMRNNSGPRACVMAIDHGPLGGEHSHIDSMGFIAYAYGQPIVLDTGMGMGYSDPLHLAWYRNAAAHNIVTIDDAPPEKIAALKMWRSTEHADILVMRSDGYLHSHGIRHERAILFAKSSCVWAIFDRLVCVNKAAAKAAQFNLHLHTPLAVPSFKASMIEGVSPDANVGLVIAVLGAQELAAPTIELKRSALPNPLGINLRQHDEMQLQAEKMMGETRSITWCQAADADGGANFITLLVPHEGARPEVTFTTRCNTAIAATIGVKRFFFVHRETASPLDIEGVHIAERSAVAVLSPGQTPHVDQV